MKRMIERVWRSASYKGNTRAREGRGDAAEYAQQLWKQQADFEAIKHAGLALRFKAQMRNRCLGSSGFHVVNASRGGSNRSEGNPTSPESSGR